MWGSIISGALNLGANIYGGYQASKAAQKAKANIEKRQRENQDWFNRRYNEDATQRADAQAIINRTEESIRNRNKAAAGTAAVMGGSAESVAAAKMANNASLSNVMSNIASDASRRKDAIESTYQANKDAYADALYNTEINRANAVAGATQEASKAFGANDLENIFSNKDEKEEKK